MNMRFHHLFRKKKISKNISAFPEGWSLTISDLMEELKNGKRKEIGNPEMTWAREYERSLIPLDYYFPGKGDLYAANFDMEIDFLTYWSAPYTGGGRGTLFKNEQIWMDEDALEERPVSALLLAVKYKELEKRMVSEGDRNAFKYESFCFFIHITTLNENFTLVKKGFEKDKFS